MIEAGKSVQSIYVFRCLSIAFLFSPFPQETPDTQATRLRLFDKDFSSVPLSNVVFLLIPPVNTLCLFFYCLKHGFLSFTLDLLIWQPFLIYFDFPIRHIKP